MGCKILIYKWMKWLCIFCTVFYLLAIGYGSILIYKGTAPVNIRAGLVEFALLAFIFLVGSVGWCDLVRGYKENE